MSGALDSYQQRARVQPAFLCLLPATSTVAATVGFAHGAVSGALTVAASTGLTYLVANFVRDRGRQIENGMWASWGGKPTTQLLQVPVDEPKGALERRWSVMSKLMPETRGEDRGEAPTEDQIDAYVGRLRSMTRNGSYRLVTSENAGYGFRRNLFGLRRVGLALAILSSAWAASALGLSIAHGEAAHASLCGAVLIADLGASFVWIRAINSNWVKQQGFNYARALFDAAESLEIRSTS